jgi:hypothetical protein
MPSPNEVATPVTRLWAIGLALGAGTVRVVDNLFRLFNLSPIGAMGIFGGARLRSWQAYVLPPAIMAATDLCLWVLHGFHDDYSLWHVSRPFVYGSFMLYVLIGRTLANTNSPWKIGAASLVGSLQFFLITNFQAWLEHTHLYARDLTGLVQCYLAGLAFDGGRTLLADLLFTAVLFGLHALAISREPAPAKAPLTSTGATS